MLSLKLNPRILSSIVKNCGSRCRESIFRRCEVDEPFLKLNAPGNLAPWSGVYNFRCLFGAWSLLFLGAYFILLYLECKSSS